MNWRHAQAFLWLRWRLLVNQSRRAGKFNAWLTVVFCVIVAVSVIPSFVASFALAVYLLPRATPTHLMYAWDGLISAFLFFWIIGLLTELQRNDPLSLAKFLHLPVSVTGAFLLNYVSSLGRLSLLMFGPVMLGFALALVVVRGREQWAVVPLLAALLLVVTALTYQFQGWLALLMNNPRRRRAVVAGVTMGIILLAQAPNLINIYGFGPDRAAANRSVALAAETKRTLEDLNAKRITPAEYTQRIKEMSERFAATTNQIKAERQTRLEQRVATANMIAPVGWLPLGVRAAAAGRAAPAAWGLLGLASIGFVSLARAYQTTIRAYQGLASNHAGRQPLTPHEHSPVASVTSDQSRRSLLEARIPGVSEPAAAIALGGFRSILRSPEAKLALLSPFILCAVFGSLGLRHRGTIPVEIRPLVGIGGIAAVLFGLLQLMGNQFGFDRDGFRLFVLSPVPRRDILLGKNLSFVPLAAVLATLIIGVGLILAPPRLDQAVALVPQAVSMYLLFCIMTNVMSIYLPFMMSTGSLKPAQPKLATILMQLLVFLLIFPLTQSLTLIPLGVEAGLRFAGWLPGVPVDLILTLVGCGLTVAGYRASLGWLGAALQARERQILAVVTNR